MTSPAPTFTKDLGFAEGHTDKPWEAYSEGEQKDILIECGKLFTGAISNLKNESALFFSVLMQVQKGFVTFVPRAATDYQNIWLHPVWFNSLNQLPDNVETAAGTVLHEVLHIAMGNQARRQWRNPRIWNIACDIVNNGLIRREFGKEVKTTDDQGNTVITYQFSVISTIRLPENVAIREDLEHLRAEEVYDKLVQEGEDENDQEGGSGDGEDGEDGEGGGSGDGKEGDEGDGDNGGGGAGKQSRSGPGKPVCPGAAKHNTQKGHNPGCFHEDPNNPNGPSEEEKKKIAEDFKNIFRRAMNEARAQGKLKGGVEEILRREIGESVVDWRDVLRDFSTKSYEDFNGPYDRRFLYQKYYFETLESESLKLYIAIDTSGSIAAQEIGEFLDEIREILRLHTTTEGKAFWADADIHGPHDVEDMLKVPVMGGGGTDFRPFFEWVEKNQEQGENAAIVYFTDGYGTFPANAPSLPTLWVVMTGGLETKGFPFGQVVRMIRTKDKK